MHGLTRRLRWFFAVLLALAIVRSADAQVPLPDAKPVPRMQAVPQPYDQVAVTRDGQEIARYHFGSSLRRPFLFPLIGPAGRSLTRMGHPHDPNTHSHHNSLWISHHDVSGVGFWNDQGKGRIVHRLVKQYVDGDESARIDVVNDWIDEEAGKLLEEERSMTFTPLDGGQWMLVIDLKLAAAGEPVVLGKTPFGPIGVRMAKTIGVHDGGGTIRNSEGAVNEKEVFWKRARWVDYSGPIAPETNEGITLMDHPTNPNHPSFFHVRDDGWMGASLTFDGPLTIEPDKPLSLRYGIYVHAGVPEPEQIDAQYKRFSEEQ